MTKLLGFLHKLEWVTKYGAAPDGVKILAEVFIPIEEEGCRQKPREIEELMVPGLGYHYVVQALTELPKEVTQSILKTSRLEQLERKMEEKYPLFANHFVQEELKQKREYYAGMKTPTIEERRETIKKGLRAMRIRQDKERYSIKKGT